MHCALVVGGVWAALVAVILTVNHRLHANARRRRPPPPQPPSTEWGGIYRYWRDSE